MMRTNLLTLAVIFLMSCVVHADPPATQPATQPAKTYLKETEAVRVNGLDFQLVAPVAWVTPAEKQETTIPLRLKVTNRTDNDIHFNPNGDLTEAEKVPGTV